MVKTQHDGDCTVHANSHGGRVEEGICICGYTFYYGRKGCNPNRNSHDKDCTIFRRLSGGHKDGICTCGYGYRGIINEDWSEMYSSERNLMLLEKNHPLTYQTICERERKKNPDISEGDLLKILEKEFELEFDGNIRGIFGGKN